MKALKLLVLFAISIPCLGFNTRFSGAQEIKYTAPKNAIEQSKKGARALEAALANAELSIPRALLTKAVAVAVLPDVKKVSMLFEGAGVGRGVVSRRMASGAWSPPVFIKLGAMSIGPQIRSDKFDVIVLFMNDKSADWLIDDRAIIFDQAKAPVAGPVGEINPANKEVVPVADVFSYTFDEGRLQGKDLKNIFKNFGFSYDNDLNKATYGVKAGAVLSNGTISKQYRVPADVMVFPEVVTRLFRPE